MTAAGSIFHAAKGKEVRFCGFEVNMRHKNEGNQAEVQIFGSEYVVEN
jgi:hypothetical protein